ncbi:hypothetical protein P280DRAFT_538592 [Massarina eburnea CBS 473.64]|uniref:Uncharacterized protein n=1 Tax=Massarina eburnea CBS 473.64 TaxID=1395130 RepID=A0A6A6RH57_9PLEO|nr:hypothetical protein P280DRAFT_538592 [Massarina eburnea CBS 473.64]
MSDNSHTHKRHHEYTYRLPTPPRIVVPPPSLGTEPPELHFTGLRATDAELDTSFLREFSLDSILQKNAMIEWQYEKRRQAQRILPWLYLGPLAAAKDREYLAREGITMVFAIRATQNSMNGILQSAKEVCQEVAAIEAPNFFQLTGKLGEATRIVNTHVAKYRKHTEATGNAQLGKVLLFCESGNEKSAAVAAAYLMETLDDFDYIKSMQVCQAQRFCVNFDDTVKLCLRSYWDILVARRSVSKSQSELLESAALENRLLEVPNPNPKRSIHDTRDDDDDDDADMLDGRDPSDVLRFEGRDFMPFMSSE